MPTALERKGDFSQSLQHQRPPITINDPLNGQKQFPGNIIPASRITATGQAILKCSRCPTTWIPTRPRAITGTTYSSATGAYRAAPKPPASITRPRTTGSCMSASATTPTTRTCPTAATGGWPASLNFLMSPIVFTQPGRLATAALDQHHHADSVQRSLVRGQPEHADLTPLDLEHGGPHQARHQHPAAQPGAEPAEHDPAT